MNAGKLGKPFIKWAGGKGQLIHTLEEHLPANFSDLSDVTYIEPFVGGGAMLFHMLQKFPNIKRAVVCDLNPNLIKTYKVVKEVPEKLIQELQNIQGQYLSILDENERKDFFLRFRAYFNNRQLSDVETAVIFIFLNRTCFNGLYRVNSKGKFNVPFGKYKNPKICDAKTILADSNLLQRVEILRGDFTSTEKFISERTFVYFDPPYRPLNATSSFNSYAKEVFNDKEQIRLKLYFEELTRKGCLMMLSNSDCSACNSKDIFFDELYKNFIIERVWAVRSVNANPSKRGKLTELLIRNYKRTQNSSSEDQRQLHVEINRSNYEQSAYRRGV